MRNFNKFTFKILILEEWKKNFILPLIALHNYHVRSSTV